MKTTFTIIGLSVLLAGLLLFAQQQQKESPMEWFNRMDRNKDGKLSKEEVPSPRFKELDTDGDGSVTLVEYKAYLNCAALKQLDRDGGQ
jgi:hypothetical protein